MMYPNTTVLMSFFFPIKAKYFVMIMGAIAFLSSVGGAGSGVSNIAHLGGMFFGFGYLRMRFWNVDTGQLRQRFQQWRLQRAKKKFQVYMKKQQSDRDRWVN